MRNEFEEIVNKNVVKWKKLNKWLATERLGKELIKARLSNLKRGKLSANHRTYND